MGWESKFFFMEPKNELHKHTNTHSSKETGFTLERKKVQSSKHSPWEGVKSPEKADITRVHILTSIDLYFFDWFWLLTYVISSQST